MRASAIEALATIGGQAGRSRIEELDRRRAQPAGVRVLAVAALARLDVDAAAARAAELIPQAAAERVDLKPLMAAFLNRQGAGAILAAAIERQHIPADSAKLALRAVYALGQADPALVAALGRAAGISTEVKPPTPAELSALVAEVAAKGDPARGELIFRRTDLNCMTCHALSKAGGDVGPDLSSIGQSSPPDYIINSILDPRPGDQGAVSHPGRPDQRRPGLSGDRHRQGRPADRAQGGHRRPAGRSRRLDRRPEDRAAR